MQYLRALMLQHLRIAHRELVRGGTLVFVMGSSPHEQRPNSHLKMPDCEALFLWRVWLLR